MKFAYADPPDSMCMEGDFVLRVPAGIGSKADLLSAFAEKGRFPSYFGGNWDALLDCLRDLSWISNRRVMVVHGDLPLHNSSAECRIYLDILQAAVADWSESSKAPTAESSPEWVCIDHELMIVFPSRAKKAVVNILAEE